jgi:hypothetical protein
MEFVILTYFMVGAFQQAIIPALDEKKVSSS